ESPARHIRWQRLRPATRTSFVVDSCSLLQNAPWIVRRVGGESQEKSRRGSDQNAIAMPNRSARDARNAAEESVEPVSGTNTSTNALTFNRGLFHRGA